jgi:hypothetical protein
VAIQLETTRGSLPFHFDRGDSSIGIRDCDSLLGHSIYARRYETDWEWIIRWEIVVAPIVRWALVLGAIGGLINLVRVRGRDVVINLLAVAVGFFLYYLATHVGL